MIDPLVLVEGVARGSPIVSQKVAKRPPWAPNPRSANLGGGVALFILLRNMAGGRSFDHL